MIVVARCVFKDGFKMRIKGVCDDKSQSAKTQASMGTKPVTTFLQGENTTTAPPPQLAHLANGCTDYATFRPSLHLRRRHTAINSIFHRPVLPYETHLANLGGIFVISASSSFSRHRSCPEVPREAEGVPWLDFSRVWESTKEALKKGYIPVIRGKRFLQILYKTHWKQHVIFLALKKESIGIQIWQVELIWR